MQRETGEVFNLVIWQRLPNLNLTQVGYDAKHSGCQYINFTNTK